MPSFAYTALNASGQTISGTVAVSSRAEAFKLLEAQALTPVRVAEEMRVAKAAMAEAGRADEQGPVRLKRSQVILFTEELADLLDGGLQIDQALRVMQERQEAPALRQVSTILREQIREEGGVAGHRLADGPAGAGAALELGAEDGIGVSHRRSKNDGRG